jgi:hypothetical protein
MINALWLFPVFFLGFFAGGYLGGYLMMKAGAESCVEMILEDRTSSSIAATAQCWKST